MQETYHEFKKKEGGLLFQMSNKLMGREQNISVTVKINIMGK